MKKVTILNKVNQPKLLYCVFCAAAIIFGSISAMAQSRKPRVLEIVNNQPFRVQMPLRVRDFTLRQGERLTNTGQPLQQAGNDIVFVADLAASSKKRLQLSSTATSAQPSQSPLTVRPSDAGVSLVYAGKNLGNLSWDIVFRNVKAERPSARGNDSDAGQKAETTRADFAAAFQALPLEFKRSSSGAVFDVWSAAATESGLKLEVELHVYHAGFLDINARLTNVQAPTADVYAAVVCRWEQPSVASRALCYDNRTRAFAAEDRTPFRTPVPGETRHVFIQRGVDWIRTSTASGASVLWLNDFAESFTVHQPPTDKRPGRYIGANLPQLGQEAQTSGETLYSITEIARAQIRSYQERFAPNVLPPPGEPLTFSSRLAFVNDDVTDERANEMFIAYAGYAEQHLTANGARVSIGVPGVRFGTNYFPYSTLGENFSFVKLPGMDREAYWPLAADTVREWRLFADDIRRDLTIAKAMGFELIRLHHLELIAPLDERTRREYLDFLFAEMRRLNLRALIDAQMKPEEIANIVRRYRDTVDAVEVENEVLIFGINDGREKYWNAVYEAVKRVAPEKPVHLTGHTNTGAFTRLNRLGIKFDRIGQHAYMDSLDAIPSARGFALAAANYAREAGKPPVITEWNWRGLTRLTYEERAKVYAPIFENVLRTRSVPEMHQFQFQETLTVDPRTRKGIRHYEPLLLSRRPKPEAFELMRLIEEYSLPTNPVRVLKVTRPVVTLDAAGRGIARFEVTNTGGRSLNLRLSVEAPSNLSVRVQNGQAILSLSPRASTVIPVAVEVRPTEGSVKGNIKGNMAGKVLPGFYHVFLRLADEQVVRYGWAEMRLEGAPSIDAALDATAAKTGVRYGESALGFDFNRPLAVVYGDDAPIAEMETAFVLANTLESATGCPVALYGLADLPSGLRERGTLIVVGTEKGNRLVASVAQDLPAEVRAAKKFIASLRATATRGEWLVIGGGEPEDVMSAGLDLTVRYWKHAKDSAARRVGLVAKEIPRGGDPALLP